MAKMFAVAIFVTILCVFVAPRRLGAQVSRQLRNFVFLSTLYVFLLKVAKAIQPKFQETCGK